MVRQVGGRRCIVAMERAGFAMLGASGLLVVACSTEPGATGPARELLVTGKAIVPPGGVAQEVGSMPMNLVHSPDGRFAIVSDMGQRESLWSIDAASGRGVSSVEFSNNRRATGARSAPTPPQPGGEATGESSGPGSPRSNGLYYGLAIASDGTVYAAQGGHDSIAVLSLDNRGSLALTGEIKTRRQDFPAGLALDDRGLLYVANNAAGEDNPYNLTASVAIYNTRAPGGAAEVGRYTFSQSYGGTSNFPYGIAATRDGGRAFVASERDDRVYVLDTTDPAQPTLRAELSTGAHPVAVLVSPDQGRLYVSNSLSDTISVVDIGGGSERIAGTVLLRPPMARDLVGVTPLGMALSRDGRTLYAALADMNAVALIDTRNLQLRAYIPAGWYPTAVAPCPDGEHMLVANAKGSRGRNPTNHPDPHAGAEAGRKTTPVLSVLEGTVTFERVPTGAELKRATAEVIAENRLTTLADARSNPLGPLGLPSGPIKHVIYIIKENRTYDQVLGDLAQGNGDPSLVLFGRDVTPNQHALAERFVLLDNLYACGEVSGDGWAWSTQGMADAYVARNVPYNYSHRGRKFDFEAHNNGYPTGGAPPASTPGPEGKPLSTAPAFANGAPPIPDVGNTGRTIWDTARGAGLSIRNYGFFLYFSDKISGIPGGPDNWPIAPGLQPPGHDLEGVTDFDFRRFDLDYPDSDAPGMYFDQTGDPNCLYKVKTYGRAGARSRFAEWNREFRMMLERDASGGAVPALMLVRLPLDHTSGASSGHHSPRSDAADNDYAVGQLVEAVSHSPIWTSTAIFIIEDDAQNGVDHVDAHRTTGFVISPWIKPGSVDHQFHNTDSMLKTMELLLGLPPLCQYDAIADPILDWTIPAPGAAGAMVTPPNAEAYQAIVPPKAIIAEMNPERAALRRGDPRLALAIRSDAMDLSHADAAPARRLNQIVWATIKGTDVPMPEPRGVPVGDSDEDDDD